MNIAIQRKIVIVCFILFGTYSYSQENIKPKQIIFTLSPRIGIDSIKRHLQTLQLPKLQIDEVGEVLRISCIADFDSVLLQKRYSQGLSFSMYPMLTLPDGQSKYSSRTIDKDVQNTIIESDYYSNLGLTKLCSYWMQEYYAELFYSMLVYDCNTPTILNSNDITGITIGKNKYKDPTIEFKFSKEGQVKFYTYTSTHVDSSVVFFISDFLFSNPRIAEKVNSEKVWIVGSYEYVYQQFVNLLLFFPLKDVGDITTFKVN